MEKMTNVKALAYVLENCTLPSDVAEKLAKMKEQTEKHNSAPRKKEGASKVAQANAPIAEAIVEFMEIGKDYSIEDFRVNVVNAHLEDATPQKVYGIIAPLVKNGTIVGAKVKGKMFYHLPVAIAE